MTLEDFIGTLVESALPALAQDASAAAAIGFVIGGLGGLAMFGALFLFGIWRTDHGALKLLRVLSAITMALLMGAGGAMLFGAIGVQQSAATALSDRPEVRAAVYPLTTTIITTAEAIAAAGPLVEQGLKDDALRAGLERHTSGVQARGYALSTAAIPETASAAKAFIQQKDSRYAKPALIAAISATIPATAVEFVPFVVDAAFDLVHKDDAQLMSLFEDSYGTLETAAARDGDPTEVTPEELGDHLVSTVITPMMLVPLGYILVMFVLSGLIPLGFTLLCVPAFFAIFRYIIESRDQD